MKQSIVLYLFTLALPCLSVAQLINIGSTAEWNAIDITTIYDDQYVSDNDFGGSSASRNGIFTDATGAGNYDYFEANAFGQVNNQAELRAYTSAFTSSVGGGGLDTRPSRINVQASAFLQRDATYIPSGGQTTASARFEFAVDGEITIDIPGYNASAPFPNFNDSGLSVDARLFEIDPGASFAEPVPVWEFFMGDFVLDPSGLLISSPNFTATEFDPANPYTPTGNTGTVNLASSPQVVPSGIQQLIVLSGSLPFEARADKVYRMDIGLSVRSNITGEEGFAEADFLNTGTSELVLVNPSDGEFYAPVPEPSSTVSGFMLVSMLVVWWRRGRTRRRQDAVS